MTKNIIALAAAALMTSSCGVLKNYERPTDIQTAGIYGDAQSGDSLGLGDLPWRTIFTDPQLQGLIEKALAQNTNMVNADLQLQQVEYALKASKLAFVPSIYFSPQGSISKMYDPYDRSQYNALTDGNNKSYSLPVSLGWQNVNFLQLRNAKKSAEINLEQMHNAKQAIQAKLVASVAQLYYNLCMLDEQLAIMQATQENWGTYLDMQRKLMDAGQSNKAAVASIEATYHSISSSVVTLENNIRIMQNSLSTLMGESAQTYGRSSLATFQAPGLIETGLPITILKRRPDVRQAELTLANSFYDMNKAKAAFWPSLNLSANGQFTNSLGSAIINPGMMIGSAIAGLTQPIFANGRIRAQYKISKAQLEIDANNFQQAVIAAGNEVNTAMLELKNAETKRELIGKQVESLQTALDATKLLYAHSSANYLNVITAQNSLLSAQMDYISNRMSAIQATISLYQALGGGTE